MTDNTGDWGYAVCEGSDGNDEIVPLSPPSFTIPEDEREYVHVSPGMTLWTRKRPETKD